MGLVDIIFILRYPHLVGMTATGGDTRGGVGDDLAEVFRGNGTALVGSIGIVVALLVMYFLLSVPLAIYQSQPSYHQMWY